MIYEATFYYDGVWFIAVWAEEKDGQKLLVKTKAATEKEHVLFPRRNPFTDDRSPADTMRGFIISLYEFGHLQTA